MASRVARISTGFVREKISRARPTTLDEMLGPQAWLFTIGQGRFYPDMQPRDVCEANCQRMEQAVVDLDSLGAVAE